MGPDPMMSTLWMSVLCGIKSPPVPLYNFFLQYYTIISIHLEYGKFIKNFSVAKGETGNYDKNEGEYYCYETIFLSDIGRSHDGSRAPDRLSAAGFRGTGTHHRIL
jgi:hypothetical protein